MISTIPSKVISTILSKVIIVIIKYKCHHVQHKSIVMLSENCVQPEMSLDRTNKQPMDTKKKTVLWVQLKVLGKNIRPFSTGAWEAP